MLLVPGNIDKYWSALVEVKPCGHDMVYMLVNKWIFHCECVYFLEGLNQYPIFLFVNIMLSYFPRVMYIFMKRGHKLRQCGLAPSMFLIMVIFLEGIHKILDRINIRLNRLFIQYSRKHIFNIKCYRSDYKILV